MALRPIWEGICGCPSLPVRYRFKRDQYDRGVHFHLINPATAIASEPRWLTRKLARWTGKASCVL